VANGCPFVFGNAWNLWEFTGLAVGRWLQNESLQLDFSLNPKVFRQVSAVVGQVDPTDMTRNSSFMGFCGTFFVALHVVPAWVTLSICAEYPVDKSNNGIIRGACIGCLDCFVEHIPVDFHEFPWHSLFIE